VGGMRKGQFYIVTTLFMVLISVGIAFFAAESRQIQRQAQTPGETGLEADAASYSAELRNALEGRAYSGDSNYVTTAVNRIRSHAESLGRNASLVCSTSTLNENTYQLNCTVVLSSGQRSVTERVDYLYRVPFQVRTFSDADLSEESDYFPAGTTVYYRVTGNNSHDVNVTAHAPNTIKYNTLHTLANHSANGSFTIGASDPTGSWQLDANDTNTTVSTSRNFSYNLVAIAITTQDNTTTPQDTFNRGDTVFYNVTVFPFTTEEVNVVVYDADGKQTSYGKSGNATAGSFTGNFTLAADQLAGTLNVTATDGIYFQTNYTNITVLAVPYSQQVYVTGFWTDARSNAFGSSCGYTSWYSSNSTTFSTFTFEVQNSTAGSQVVSVSNQSKTISLPHVKANKLHIISSRCDTC
jgi:hypothetical protein